MIGKKTRFFPGIRFLCLTAAFLITCSAAFANEQTNTYPNNILIETQILHVSNVFLKQVGLDVNSLKESDIWSKYSIENSNEPNTFVLDEPSAALFQQTIDTRQDVNVIKHLKVIASTGKRKDITIPKDEPVIVTGGQIVEVLKDYSIYLTPEILNDNNIELNLKIRVCNKVHPNESIKVNDVTKAEEITSNNKNERELPRVRVSSKTITVSIPDGQTLLIIGNNISRGFEYESKVPILGDIPLVGLLFKNRSYIKDEYIQLFLIKPTILTPEEAEKMSKEEINNFQRKE